MRQCRTCGERDPDKPHYEFEIDALEDATEAVEAVKDGVWKLLREAHVVYGEEHWPVCDGSRCHELMCPMEVEELCGPVLNLGHGGNLQRRTLHPI